MPKKPEKLGPLVHTPRGFERITFADHYGVKCSLQQSSLADLDAVWLGSDENQPVHHVMGESVSPRMHLTRPQVIDLVARLRAWLKTTSFKPVKPKKRRKLCHVVYDDYCEDD